MGKAVYNEFVMCSFGVKLTIQIQKQPPEMCYKKGVLKIFCKIHRKTPVSESLFNKVARLRPATLIKKKLWHKCFPVNFAKFLRTPFLQNTPWRLLLRISIKEQDKSDSHYLSVQDILSHLEVSLYLLLLL